MTVLTDILYSLPTLDSLRGLLRRAEKEVNASNNSYLPAVRLPPEILQYIFRLASFQVKNDLQSKLGNTARPLELRLLASPSDALRSLFQSDGHRIKSIEWDKANARTHDLNILASSACRLEKLILGMNRHLACIDSAELTACFATQAPSLRQLTLRDCALLPENEFPRLTSLHLDGCPGPDACHGVMGMLARALMPDVLCATGLRQPPPRGAAPGGRGPERVARGARYEYLWEDGVRYKRPTKLPAPEYVDALMNWAQGLLDNEDVFPNRIGVPFPKNFRDTIRTIFRRMFRVYAHLYSNHFDHICALGIEAHLNTSYRHFFLFVHEFDLVDKKELAPLDELNDAILAEDKTR
ncbi:hypothetical protein EVJ58_g9333 [Rhodofomes roseus]|uniref:Uncharacterized protein n=1 Tax=Rhodofomes roseus TaxID=34475 RepID=A0A4Y9XU57_9APHY|nr:hypothetical protein EVJ58_g9333 [Rhodofomes roseus]